MKLSKSPYPQILLLGNGLNRAYGGDNWQELIKKLHKNRKVSLAEIEKLPLPMQVVLATEDKVDNTVLKKLDIFHGIVHSSVMSVECSTRTLDRIVAEYTGSISAGTVIDNGCKDITVSAYYKNGDVEDVKNWTIESPVTLQANTTSTVTITYQDKSCSFDVECGTKYFPMSFAEFRKTFSEATDIGISIGGGDGGWTIFYNGKKVDGFIVQVADSPDVGADFGLSEYEQWNSIHVTYTTTNHDTSCDTEWLTMVFNIGCVMAPILDPDFNGNEMMQAENIVNKSSTQPRFEYEDNGIHFILSADYLNTGSYNQWYYRFMIREFERKGYRFKEKTAAAENLWRGVCTM